MYSVNIEGAGRGVYQKVKKLLKDNGIFEPSNCTYEDKTFVFAWPEGADMSAITEGLDGLGLSVAESVGSMVDRARERAAEESDVVADHAVRLRDVEDELEAVSLSLEGLGGSMDSIESRVESMDRTLFHGLRGLVLLIDHLETVVDPTTSPAEKAEALTSVQATIATMKEVLKR
jgi:hypothetical protein